MALLHMRLLTGRNECDRHSDPDAGGGGAGADSLPLYAALMMKDDIVSAITFYDPTAG
ncbi:MAG: hypothetical protein NC305_10400 [Lachnospiraceae bacterium]|nr:hypothetical protein [Muribaculaceae bacterium]MCM1410942.1 hypothetical protein [Lachnospiraceae bacterium]